VSGLAQGEDIFEIDCKWETEKENLYYEWDESIPFSWNDLFFTVSPLLMHESTTSQLHERLVTEVRDRVRDMFRDDLGEALDEIHKGHRVVKTKTSQTDLETIIVQFRALGYMQHSAKTRSVKDRGDYWTLTPYGEVVMNQLRAVRKE
jgi:hypothetical protein